MSEQLTSQTGSARLGVCIGAGTKLNESEVRSGPIPFTKTLEPLDY